MKSERVKIGHYNGHGKELIETIIYPRETFEEIQTIVAQVKRDFAIAVDNDVTLVMF